MENYIFPHMREYFKISYKKEILISLLLNIQGYSYKNYILELNFVILA